MDKKLKLLTGMFLVLALTSMVGTASAMSAFSRKYNVNCDTCHSNIPQLNEFGLIFKNNGFVIPGQKIRARSDESPVGKEIGAAGTEPVKLPKVEVKFQTEPSTVEKNATSDREEGGEAVDTPAAKPPVVEAPPTVVYKGNSRDGSVYYTDNPYRKDFVSREQERSVRQKPAPFRSKKRFATKTKRGVLMEGRQPHAKGPVTAVTKVETYRSHEECMERQLVEAPPPASAEEMMAQLSAAELKCATYEMQEH